MNLPELLAEIKTDILTFFDALDKGDEGMMDKMRMKIESELSEVKDRQTDEYQSALGIGKYSLPPNLD